MFFWTFFTACTQPKPPVAGSLQLCFPNTVAPSMSDEQPVSLQGDLIGIQDGSGDCTADLVIQNSNGEIRIGYSIIDPEGNDATLSFLPAWNSAEGITLTLYTQFSFGQSHGLVMEDSDGILIALDEGTWGGALSNAELPFEVGQSENPVGSIEEECMTQTGYTFSVEGTDMAPFGEFDIELIGKAFTFVAISALEYGEGRTCSISDMTDEFAWGIFRQ